MTDTPNDVLRQELELSTSYCPTVGITTETPAESWVERVSAITLEVWVKLIWQRQRQADSAGGIKRLVERRYPDFDDRTRALASLIIAVAPLPATPGHVTDTEYQEHLQVETRRLLPFFDGPVRKALASRLIAEHAMQNNIEVEDPGLVDGYEWPDRAEYFDQVPCMEPAPGRDV
jgi:hypothetical protein